MAIKPEDMVIVIGGIAVLGLMAYLLTKPPEGIKVGITDMRVD